jgi:hypothetical protein
MDLARTCTTRPCQFFDDPSAPWVTIKWYRAASDAKWFPTPHKWGHLAWYSFPWEATGVGEIYGTPERWSNGFTPPTSTGQSYYGPLQYFQAGCPFDPFLTVPRDTWGLAIACTGPSDNFVLLEDAYNPVVLTEDGGYVLLE